MTPRFTVLLALIVGLIFPCPCVPAQIDSALASSLEFRNIGPFRGGRAATVTGVPGRPMLYYFGAAGGGVWKTQDGGQSWTNISDGYFGGSIGAVAVSESDPNVIYVGGGEKTVRGNVSYGYGLWKSIDGGKTWESLGLKDSRHVGRIRIDPRDPDRVYVAVMGDLFKDSEERGVYRTTDGGKSWERVLFAGGAAGAVDIDIAAGNPRLLFASTWNIRRTPYSLESGGRESTLYRSTDGGDTWEDLRDKPGLPKGLWGISGVSISRADNDRVYAIIENEKGGVFRSDDAGNTWQQVNDDRALRQRAWYYTRIYADPNDRDGVYVMNVDYHHSTDGGRSFESARAPHGDHHDLWIAPENSDRMIIGDDGGAQVSFDGGDNWSTYRNQPTSQFYRVVTDNSFPYRIYGAQQDNSTVRIPHRTDGRTIGESDWEETAGGESAHLAPDPKNNDIVYGGSYGGFLSRYDHENNQVRGVNVWPDNPMGYGAEGMKYRFQWNFPIFFSPNDPNVLYTTSQHVHRSTDEGQSWEIISPDLTRADPEKLKSSGGPITKDNTGVEYYATIFAATEVPGDPGVLWAASDDGLIHVRRGEDAEWDDVTPKDAPERMMWNSVEPDPARRGTLYVAGTRYKLGDYTPYLYKTTDYGKNWTRIDRGIDRGHFTRVVRKYDNLLFAGTESGLYLSTDDGRNWQSFQKNLPIVPITDIAVKDDNLIVATQGRSFWIMDDLRPLTQVGEAEGKDVFVFAPTDVYRMGGSSRKSRTEGQNHPGGANFHLYLSDAAAEDSTEIEAFVLAPVPTEYSNGAQPKYDTLKTWSTEAKDKADQLERKAGGQVLNWNLRYPEGTKFDGMILWWAGLSGPMALPGEYEIVLRQGERESRQDWTLVGDPRVQATPEDLAAQFDFMKSINDKVSEAHQVIIDLRKVRGQIEEFQRRLPQGADALREQGTTILDQLTEVEEALYQTKNRSRQDPLNYPIRLTNKLAHLSSLTSIGAYRPTDAAVALKAELTEQIDAEIAKYRQVVEDLVPQYNRMILEQDVEVISVPGRKKAARKK